MAKNEDQQIIDFLEAIKQTNNTKFLLTTRSHILSRAQLTYEKLNSIPIQKGKYSVELSDYNSFERAKILYNHLWYSALPDESINDIVQQQKYFEIISHRNFTPRIVKAMTSIDLDKTKSYAQNFFENLENPEAIWEHAFGQQIADPSRRLLLVLNTLPDGIQISKLHEAFLAYNNHQAQKFGCSIKESDFRTAIKELDGAFIVFSHINSQSDNSVDFENPSIHDFVNHYLMKNPELFDDLFRSTVFFQQNFILWYLINELNDQYELNLERISKELINSIKRTFFSELDSDNKNLEYNFQWSRGYLRYPFEKRLYLLLKLFEELHNLELQNFISDLLKILISNIKDDKINRSDFFGLLDYIFEVDNTIFDFSVTKEEIFIETKEWLLKKIELLDDFEHLRQFLQRSKWKLSESEFERVQSKFNEEFSSFVIEEYDTITNKKIVSYQYQNQIEDQLNSDKISEVASFIEKFEKCSEYFNIDLDEEIEELKKKVNEYYKDYSPDEDDLYDDYREGRIEEKNRDESLKTHIAIEQLFSELGD